MKTTACLKCSAECECTFSLDIVSGGLFGRFFRDRTNLGHLCRHCALQTAGPRIDEVERDEAWGRAIK